MRAGSLDKMITIQSRVTTVDAGKETDAWITVANVRAMIVRASTEETMAYAGGRLRPAFGDAGTASLVCHTRYLGGVTVDNRVIHEDRILNVREVKVIGRRRGLEISCEETHLYEGH